jgi:hypothetical protein
MPLKVQPIRGMLLTVRTGPRGQFLQGATAKPVQKGNLEGSTNPTYGRQDQRHREKDADHKHTNYYKDCTNGREK